MKVTNKNNLTVGQLDRLIKNKDTVNWWNKETTKTRYMKRKVRKHTTKILLTLMLVIPTIAMLIWLALANNVEDEFETTFELMIKDEISIDDFVYINTTEDNDLEEIQKDAEIAEIMEEIRIANDEIQEKQNWIDTLEDIKNIDIIWDKLFETTKVIGCYNQYSKTSRVADKCTKGWDHNISIPPKSHLQKWRDIGWNDREIVNRFPIVNFESNFREYVWNPYAYWYVQTLRKYNIAPEITPQLEWMYNRQKYQKMKFSSWGSKRCGIYADEYNYKDWFNAGEEWVMACLYRFHYHAYKWMWYAKRGMEARQIYIDYFYNQ